MGDRALRIVHVTGEVAPYSKTGGLGDVLAELPRFQRAAGLDARVLTPLYGHIDRRRLTPGEQTPVLTLGGKSFQARLWHDDGHVAFVDIPGVLDRPHNYGDGNGEYPDNPLRFAALCKVAAALWPSTDVFHLHDWQAGLTALYLGGRRPALLTVHNLAYQGLCGFEWADRLDIPPALRSADGVEYYGRISLLKAGLVLADRLTTVSPTYAREIQSEPLGLGLAGLFRHRRAGLEGILNGIDPAEWNPAADPALPATFAASDLAGRKACQDALRREFGLADGPIFGVVSRAAGQKGLDLLAEAADPIVRMGGKFAVLSAGERGVVAKLRAVADRHPTAFTLIEDFDPARARRVYAGADFLVVPSRYEPCGLAQLIAMRYGAIPVVRRTGGLADTVEDGVTGLCFDDVDPGALAHALHRAYTLAADRAALAAMQARGLARDWSWDGPAAAYAALYRRLTAGGRTA